MSNGVCFLVGLVVIVGCLVVGYNVGAVVGCDVGLTVGSLVVGCCVGWLDGGMEGLIDGPSDGVKLGLPVGAKLGSLEGATLEIPEGDMLLGVGAGEIELQSPDPQRIPTMTSAPRASTSTMVIPKQRRIPPAVSVSGMH